MLALQSTTLFVSSVNRDEQHKGNINLIKGTIYNNITQIAKDLNKRRGWNTGIPFISIRVRISIYHTQPDLLASTGSLFNFQAMIKQILIKLEQINKNRNLKRLRLQELSEKYNKKMPQN